MISHARSIYYLSHVLACVVGLGGGGFCAAGRVLCIIAPTSSCRCSIVSASLTVLLLLIRERLLRLAAAGGGVTALPA